MRFPIATLAFLLSASIMHAQQPSKPARPTAPQTAPAAAEDTRSRQDLQRMKSLVEQMQRNLANVSSSQDPLKHQFELEIEMWQLEITRMERGLNAPSNQ